MGLHINPDANEIVSDRSLIKMGGSHVITIPPAVLSGIDIEEGEEIQLVHELGSDTIELHAQPREEDSE